MPVATTHTVIIHATRSGHSMNPTEFIGTLNYMATPGTVSSHWVIARNGTKARVVADNRQAWHAQEDNYNAWGIELEQGIEADGFTQEQIAALVLVCRGYIEDFGVAAVHCATSTEPGFIGHQETVQGKRNGKSDPGHLFDWTAFIAALTPTPITIAGIGVRYDDDSTAEIWTPVDGKTLTGVGARLSDGSEVHWWP